MNINRKQDALDVHFKNEMVCVDCHESYDIHGDGISYKTMRDKDAVKVTCRKCHEKDSEDTLLSHAVHKNVDCSACHIKNTTTCINCHFDRFLETGKRKDNFMPPSQTWTLLMNYQGMVVPANVQTLVYKNKKFVAYAPYFTHSVQKEGKECSECHGTKAAKLIKKGKSVTVFDYKNGKPVHWQGVIPVVPDRLKWVFLNKKEDKWVPIISKEKPKIQLVGYGKSLTQKQVISLAKSEKKLRKQIIK